MPNCIFCKIIRGELPSTKIYEDETTLAFLDIHPVNPGHTLVVPKEHAENIFEISPEQWAAVQETVRRVAIAIEKGLQADGVNVNMNNREHAGQVVDHAHVHLIPRFKGDGFAHWPHSNYQEGEAVATADKIKKAL
ncbi:MAG TPA: HIT family protein [Candidatus Paceibacterota bacterium]|nr:HIT family protein [Candidatus Paceibacterota bacterium]